MESAKEKRILFVLAEMLIFDNCLYFNVNFALFFRRRYNPPRFHNTL